MCCDFYGFEIGVVICIVEFIDYLEEFEGNLVVVGLVDYMKKIVGNYVWNWGSVGGNFVMV